MASTHRSFKQHVFGIDNKMGMALKKIYVYTSWKHINIKLVMVEIKTQSNRDKI